MSALKTAVMDGGALQTRRYMATMTDTELSPCPFCGGAGEWEYAPRNEETDLGDDGTGWVRCIGCKVRVTGCYRGEAEAKWNTRTNDAMLPTPDTLAMNPQYGYGCHCDLDPGQKPDKCVIDEGSPFDCTKAQRLLSEGKGRNDCDEWKPIVRMRY